MDVRSVNIYPSIDKDYNFIFPEIEDQVVNPNLPAIAVSGGGTRSVACAMGFFRALRDKNPNFLEGLSYLSSTSGGSWFTSIVTLAKDPLNDMIGQSIPIHDINRHTLSYTNFDSGKRFLGIMLVNCPIKEYIFQGLRSHLPSNKIWDFTCSAAFLDRYDLDDMFVVQDDFSVKFHSEFNAIKCVRPKDGMPFNIVTSAIINDPDELETLDFCEFTPMYSGVRVPNPLYGGTLIENPGFGCAYFPIHTQDAFSTDVDIHPFRDNTLEVAVGSSSAAFSFEALKFSDSVIPFLQGLSDLTPITNVWGFTSETNHELILSDGGFLDYTGIIPLAARGCKKILAFLNCGKFDGNYCEFGITQLFGLDEDFKCRRAEMRTDIDIFSLEDWIEMRKDFEKRNEEGKMGYFYRKMMVKPNWKAGVNGNYECELLMVPLFEHKGFEEQLKVNIRSNSFPELHEFPNINYLFANPGKILELTNSQVNILSTYCDWYLKEVMKEVPEFFEDF